MKLFIDIGIVVITITMMLAVGLDLSRRTVAELLEQRFKHLFLLVFQIAIPPLIGIALVLLFPLPPQLGTSILLLAACPIGDIANVYTVYARGNPALSLTLNAITCLLAPVTMLVTFAITRQLGIPHELLAVPGLALVGRLLLLLVLPVTIGALVTARYPAIAQRIRQPLHRFVGLGILLLLTLILSTQWAHVITIGPAMAFLSLCFMGACMGAGGALNKMVNLSESSARASLLCLPVRNVGVATLISITLLERVEYAGIAAVYFLTEVPLMLFVCRRLRRED